MSIPMHAASAAIFLRQLGGLQQWLDKAEAHAQARGFPADNYLALRLAPDMLPLASQVRIAGDVAKACMARLSGQTAPVFEDNETTFAELRQRVQRTLDYISSVPAEAVNGSEQREVVVPVRNRDALKFTGEFYLRHWALPNFFFHCTTTYALLRHAGVVLGKQDFLALG